MYKSPIELIYKDVQYQVEESIYKAVQKVDIKVDREELIKALEYDRGQYDKGYEDAKAERKKGRWLNKGRKICCSECGRINFCMPNFCDECGADMREEKQDG